MANDPRRRYFVATGPDAQALLARVEEHTDAHHERTKAYTAQYGARFIMQRNGYPTGILLDEDSAVPEGFKFIRLIEHMGIDFMLCEPVGNTKAGRAAKAAAAKVGVQGVSEMICRHYDVYGRMFIVGGNASWHPVGWCSPKQKLVTLQVPETADDRYTPHAELREISYSQYVAITEEGAPAPAEPLHDNLRDRIGQALADEMQSMGDPREVDWCDSREIDRLADAVMAVLSKEPK